MAPWYQLRMREGKGGISAGSLAVQAHPFWVSPAGKPVPGGEEEGGSPQLDTDTHTWFSRGSAGSVHSPRGLLGSMPRGLADLGFPADSLGGSRPFSSRPGDRQFFSDPSNWAVRNRLVMDSEVSRGKAVKQPVSYPASSKSPLRPKACSGRACLWACLPDSRDRILDHSRDGDG